MPKHHESEVTELTPLSVEDEADEVSLIVKQSGEGASDVDQSDEQDDDLEDEDLEDEEGDEEDDETDEDEDEDQPKPESKDEKKPNLFKNPLPRKEDLDPELHEAWDLLNAARQSQNADYTQKTQELAKRSERVSVGEQIVEALTAAGADINEVAQTFSQLAEAAKQNGGDLAAAAESLKERGPDPDVLSVGQIDPEAYLNEDEQLLEWAEALSNSDELTEREYNAILGAYENREAALRLAVAQHNQQVQQAQTSREGQRNQQLEDLKSDKRLGKFVAKDPQAVLREAERLGISDLRVAARSVFFEEAAKAERQEGRRRMNVSRQKNLDVGDESGDFDIEGVSQKDLDRGFQEGGLAGMVRVQRRSVAGSRRR